MALADHIFAAAGRPVLAYTNGTAAAADYLSETGDVILDVTVLIGETRTRLDHGDLGETRIRSMTVSLYRSQIPYPAVKAQLRFKIGDVWAVDEILSVTDNLVRLELVRIKSAERTLERYRRERG